MIISSIDEDLDTVARTLNPQLDLRDIQKERAKRSPFTFVGHIGEKLFGLGRKESIQIVQQNQELLAQQVNTKFEQLAGDSQKLWSANRLQNLVLHDTVSQISIQETLLNNLTQSLYETQLAVNIIKRYQSEQFLMLYHLLSHQSVIQTQLLKITMKIVNTLRLIHVQTGKLSISVQKLVRGDMPPELVTPQMFSSCTK